MPYEVIEYALKRTSRIADPNWNYAITILDDYVKKNIKTVEQAKSEEFKFKSRKHTNETEEEKQARRLKELEEMEKEENK